MSKIDKFLYGGFGVVALGVVVALLVPVFSLPKQVVEKTVETPQIERQTEADSPPVDEPPQLENGYVAFYFDANGNKVYVTQEQLDAGEAYEEELKRKEAERIAKEKADKEWWESRQDWVDRFPFEPTPHPEITFDSSVYDPTRRQAEEEMDDDYWKMFGLARNHSFLQRFYESRLPYTEEFEQLYDIVKEEIGEEKADNTVNLGWTFNTLRKYHQAKTQDPDDVYQRNAKVTQVPQNPPPSMPDMLAGLTPEQLNAYIALPEREKRKMTAELRASRIKEWEEKVQAYENSFQPQTRDITWGEEVESLKECILGALTGNDENPDQLWIPIEQALAIRERLINEIPAEGFINMDDPEFGYVRSYYANLKTGDKMLVK